MVGGNLCCLVNPKFVCTHCNKCPAHDRGVCEYHTNPNYYTYKCRICGYSLSVIKAFPIGECKKRCYQNCRTFRRLKNGGHIRSSSHLAP